MEIKRVQAAINKSFMDTGLDAVICPVFPTPAVNINDTQDIFGNSCNHCVLNKLKAAVN